MASFLQKLGLKRAEPGQQGQQVRVRRSQSENHGIGVQGYKVSDAQFSAAPTEVQSGGIDRVSPTSRAANPLDYAVSGATASSYYQSDSKMTSTDGQDYQIVQLLGQGTQGKVWEAALKRSGKSVVIKCLHQQHVVELSSKDAVKKEQAKLFWRAFRNEIDVLEACSGHPNIVKIVGRSPDYSQFMMEKAGADLNKCLKVNREVLSLGQCHKWFTDILVGVEHLHHLGITHTDLKPENMLIGSDNQIKICDFGMAQKAVPGTKWAVTGELSTLWYRAPELLLGCQTFDEKIDEWAVGCIAMEMLCGMTVFQGQASGTCQCPDIAHRNFNSSQLGQILQVAGSPKSLAGFGCAGHVKEWPAYQRQLETVVKKYCQAKRRPDEHPDASGNVRKPYHSSTLWADAISGLLTVLPDERMSSRRALTLPLFADSAVPFALSTQTLASQAEQQPLMEARPVAKSQSMTAGRSSGMLSVKADPKVGANVGIGAHNRQALQQAISQANVIVQGTG